MFTAQENQTCVFVLHRRIPCAATAYRAGVAQSRVVGEIHKNACFDSSFMAEFRQNAPGGSLLTSRDDVVIGQTT